MKKLILTVACVLGVSAMTMAQTNERNVEPKKAGEFKTVQPAAAATPIKQAEKGPQVKKKEVVLKERSVRPAPKPVEGVKPAQKTEVIVD